MTRRGCTWLILCVLSLPIDAVYGQPAGDSLSNVSPPPTPDNSAVQLSTITIESHYDTALGTSDAASQGAVNGELLQDMPNI
jgi:hypothetical protein